MQRLSSLIRHTGILLSCLVSVVAFSPSISAENKVIVSKSRQELTVLQDERIIRQFRIAYGKGGNGTKRESGDRKTPEGYYRIIDLKESDQFFYFIHLDYPNLADAWHGYHKNLISSEEFKLIARARKLGVIPPQNTNLGGYIGIHGIGPVNHEKLDIHNQHNWTNGCIAMTNDEIAELKNLVNIGTLVVIRE